MERRTTLADIRNASRKRTAKREGLLRQTDTLVALVKPHYYEGRQGRKPTGIERRRHP